MVQLKSYRFKDKAKRKMKPAPKLKSTGRIIQGGITALIGTAFVSQTASVLRRI